MNTGLDLGCPCPACGRAMHPHALACECGVRVEGPIAVNEFASLEPEQLHLLRIFLKCEGRIRDMEAALGISYPTVKSRIRDLKIAIGMESSEPEDPDSTSLDDASNDDIDAVLAQLEEGAMSVKDAIGRIRQD